MDDELRWYLLFRKKTEGHISVLFQTFREYGVEPILIKGWAAARNYPSNVPRFYGDTDLAVSDVDYQKAFALVQGPNAEARGVDLHRELRHLDTLPWNELFSRSELIEVDGSAFRVPSAEDHLRILCVHWLTNAGEDKERLFDIYYAIANRPVSFDWGACLDVVTPNRRTWIIATVGLAHKYLGLHIDDLPFADKARRLPGWLTESVERSWRSGSRLRGIDESITDGRLFIRQVRNRIPPNPIQSTINCEEAIDESSRIGVQLKDIFGRFIPSVKRLSRAVTNQARWKMRSK